MKADDLSHIPDLRSLVREPDLHILDITLSSPNIFEILGVSSYEIRHSNFLAWLLTPGESHQLGDVFLKWFLKDLFSDGVVPWINEFEVDGINTKNIVVYREFNYIDILIEHDDFVIIIENKFGSKEHSDQLKKYKNLIDDKFNNKNKAYVFLTPTGEVPESQEDSDCYISISYEIIIQNLERILHIDKDSISPKIINILEDYISSIRRKVMRDDQAVQIAHEIYKNHRRALEFIFEHKPDHFEEMLPSIEEAVISKGYVLGAKNKNFCRFNTPILSEKLEKSSVRGWSDNAPMAFELNFRGNSISFAVTIAPNEQEIREILMSAISKVTKKRPKSKQWSTMFSRSYKEYDLEKMHDKEEVREVILKILNNHSEIIDDIEKSILSHV